MRSTIQRLGEMTAGDAGLRLCAASREAAARRLIRLMTEFVLDPRLATDTAPLARLRLCEMRLMDDARFPWIVLVPMRAGATEIFDLEADDRAALIEEVAAASESLKRAVGAAKVNVGALGNIVRQLHIHVVARFEGDAAWPGPVWGFGARVPYAASERDGIIRRVAETFASLN